MNTKLFPCLAATFAVLILWSHVPNASGTLIGYYYTAVHESLQASVAGTFGYDDSADDQNPSVAEEGWYLTGFYTGTVTDGPQDGLQFDLNLSGSEDPGNLFTRITDNILPNLSMDPEVFLLNKYVSSWTSLVELQNNSGSEVFLNDSLPATLNLSDFEIARAIVFNDDGTLEIYNITTLVPITGAPVPEPATVLLLGTGLVGLVGFRKKFKK